jgi:O-antigen ligase
MTALGRSENEMESLTGRIPLWTELLQKPVSDKLLLGHGYGAFWTAAHVKEMSDSYGWLIPNAHSTYIDLLLSVGLIGAILCVSVLIVALIKASLLEHQQIGFGYGFIAQVVLVAMCAGVLETFLGSTCFLSLFSKCGTFYLLFKDGGPKPGYEVAQPLRSADGLLSPDCEAAV